MPTRNYPRLGIVPFAQHLLRTGDLDPIYLALNKVQWPEAQKYRWLVAYCAFYHAGVACYMSELHGDMFWAHMMWAAKNEEAMPPPVAPRWPRGHERRHFRGEQAVKGIQDWQTRYPVPESMFLYIRYNEPGSTVAFGDVRARALEHRSVGEWLSFKMVDLVDACLGVEVDQSDLMNFMYDAPRKSLLREWREQYCWGPNVMPKDAAAERKVIEHMNRWLATELREFSIPHKPGQPLAPFELETVWCKHQSHLNGHYPLHNDIHEINAGLLPWLSTCDAAMEFFGAMPPGGES